MNGKFPITVIHDLSDEELDALEPFEATVEELLALGVDVISAHRYVGAAGSDGLGCCVEHTPRLPPRRL